MNVDQLNQKLRWLLERRPLHERGAATDGVGIVRAQSQLSARPVTP